MTEEPVIYQDQAVTVTKTRFIAWGKTYAMNQVVSVRSGFKAASNGGWVLLLLVGIVMLPLGIGEKQTALAIVGGLLLVLAIAGMRASKGTYSVVLTTSSGEVQAISTKERAYVDKVVAALNEAIVARG